MGLDVQIPIKIEVDDKGSKDLVNDKYIHRHTRNVVIRLNIKKTELSNRKTKCKVTRYLSSSEGC
jgi:hypothetical protein